MSLSRFAMLALAGSFIATAALADDANTPGTSTPTITKEVLVAQRDDRYVEVCNKSSQRISVAKATSAREQNNKGEDLFFSQGWWTLDAGDCMHVWDGPLQNRWYYVYAESGRSTWAGNYPFCVRKDRFNIKDAQCGEGYERRNFNRIDMNDDPGQPVRYSFTD